MKLSEHPDYKTAVFASLNGDLSLARESYERLLDVVEETDDASAIAFVMQSLANIEARDGNFELAHELHQRAIGQSPGIPLTVVSYAKSLVEHFDQIELAKKHLQEAERVIDSDLWDRRADNISLKQYQELIAQIREKISEN